MQRGISPTAAFLSKRKAPGNPKKLTFHNIVGRRGISPIVAVVLLISISVIAATGIWFWIGGLASKQSTPSTPVVLNAQSVTCGTGSNNVTAMVQNLHASTDLTSVLQLIVDNGTCYGEVAQATNFSYAVTINAGEQAAVNFDCYYNDTDGNGNKTHTAGSTYTLYGATTGSAAITC